METLSARIKRLTSTYALMYGQQPTALFVPYAKVPALIVLAEQLCGRELDEVLVLDTINGLKIKLCTGAKLGVGRLREDETTPHQESIWHSGDDADEIRAGGTGNSKGN